MKTIKLQGFYRIKNGVILTDGYRTEADCSDGRITEFPFELQVGTKIRLIQNYSTSSGKSSWDYDLGVGDGYKTTGQIGDECNNIYATAHGIHIITSARVLRDGALSLHHKPF